MGFVILETVSAVLLRSIAPLVYGCNKSIYLERIDRRRPVTMTRRTKAVKLRSGLLSNALDSVEGPGTIGENLTITTNVEVINAVLNT